MALIALGGNLPHPRFGPPRNTLEEALRRLEAAGCQMLARSRWYRSAPVPPSGQPDFVNGVALLRTALDPERLLALLHRVELDLGRARGERNAPRTVDLDLLAQGALVRSAEGPAPILPHPRMLERGFVLKPLCDIAADWRHPLSGRPAREHLAALDPEDAIEPCTE
ncbi:MAG: 2-amino-4-hydroxy-6-hydroxymethyldihydropteridine diphosphokinase [Alphaproteobacteria bacterium]|nr:2-amino-4-hydroxy-6-hydroxymethyldihydropteridine diphosphokinase [Alphaproteobacteria bacterium]